MSNQEYYEMEEKKGSAGRVIRNIFLVILALLLAAVLGVYIYGIVYFQDKFFMNTRINGIDVSEMTSDQVNEKISAIIAAYKLDLSERGDKQETITSEQIDYHFVSKGEVETFLNGQKLYEWPIYLLNGISYTFESSAQYDEALLEKVLSGLDCFNEEKVVRPQDAYIEYLDGKYQVMAEVEGNLLREEEAKKLIRETIDYAKTSVSFEENHLYEAPVKYQDDEIMNDTCKKLNTCISTNLTYHFGDNSEELTGSMVREWLSYDDDGNVELDKDAVYQFVSNMSDKYDTLGKDREFVTHSGSTVVVDGCDYGWEMDKDATYDYLVDAIWAGNQGDTYAEYIQTAVSWYNSDLGDSYVEIDLGSQHVWLYIDGEEIVSTDCVSGTVSDSARRTPSGTYTLYYKESPSVLKGENAEYETKVTYWMPFNDGIGLHDASWRTSFGGNIYQTDGSHGCINLPVSAAKAIYENVYDGIPIICYY